MPILQGLIKRIRAKPLPKEIEYMRKTDVKELRLFFDALSSGQPDQETYDQLLDYIRGRHEPGYVTIAQRKVKEEADRKAKEEADRKAKEEAERRAKEEAERKAKEEAERKAKEEAARKAKEEADRKAKVEAERRAMEDAERRAKDEAARKAKEEADRKAKEEADRLARKEAAKRALLSKAQTRSLGKDIDISLAEASGKFTVFVTNKGSSNVALFLDFGESDNMAVEAVFGPTKQPQAMQIEVTVPKGSKELQLARLAPVNSSKSFGLSYKAKMREEGPPAPEEDPDQVTKIADGLSLIVRSTETGYKVLVTNAHPTHRFLLKVNFQDSVNLKVSPLRDHKLETPATIVGTVTNGHEQEFALAAVDNFELGSCDIRYRVSARVEE